MTNVITRLIIAAVAVVVFTGSAALAQDSTSWSNNVSPLPSPTGPVNDYANVIDDATENALKQKLIDFQRSSGVEMAVAVVNTTGDRQIYDYSLAVARGWGIGSKGDDNPSLLLFIAVDDRKYQTQVSRDLEDELPDGIVGQLQRQYLVPEFKKGNYGKGISDTIDAYIATYEQRSSGSAASPTPVPGRERGMSGVGQSVFSTFCCIVIIGIIILIIIGSRGGRSGRGGSSWGGGGGFGGSGGALPWIIGSAIANAASSSSSSSSDWGSSSSSSDWGSSGGGSDWGGFGGGGDFGGGGAGGDW